MINLQLAFSVVVMLAVILCVIVSSVVFIKYLLKIKNKITIVDGEAIEKSGAELSFEEYSNNELMKMATRTGIYDHDHHVKGMDKLRH